LQEDDKVLEIGCGAGNLSRFLVQRLHGGELICLDISNYWLNKAKERLEKFNNIKYKLRDLTKLNLENSYYDIVILHYVLHDIKKEHRLNTIKTLKNKLKNKGVVYIREPTRKNHGILPQDVEKLMLLAGFSKKFSKESYSFPLRGKVYEATFTQ